MSSFKCKECHERGENYEGCQDRCPSFVAAWLDQNMDICEEIHNTEINRHLSYKWNNINAQKAKYKKSGQHVKGYLK